MLAAMQTLIRILASALSVGLFFAILGFFGPMLLAPGHYGHPLTGLYIGGGIGVVLGVIIGCLGEFRRDD